MSALTYRINDQLAAAKIYEDEAIVINTATGRYYDLEGSAPALWLELEHGATAEQLSQALAERYEVDRSTALLDVQSLLDRLVEEDLVVTAEGTEVPGHPAAAPTVAERSPYVAPELTTFTDMQDLLAADPPLPAAYTPSPGDAGEVR